MTQTSKGHPHAALMLEYAKDAAEHAEPWKLWERETILNKPRFVTLTGNPEWHPNLVYRRRATTIRIGGIEVPEPLRVEPERGTKYWVVNANSMDLCFFTYWEADEVDQRRLGRSLTHLTKEAAEAHARALIAVSGGEV